MLQTTILSILAFLVTILILVTIHEFGHFWVAKRMGVGVLRFSIGFGKPLIRWQGKDGTEYVIAWLPLGGYVKLLDEREEPVPEDRQHLAFNRQSLFKRTLIVIAGPAINIVFAILAFWIVWMAGMERATPVIGEVLPNSIAASSGMKAGEKIVAIDDNLVDGWMQVSMALVKRIGGTGNLLIGAGALDKTAAYAYVLPLVHWKVDGLNPDPLKGLGIVPYSPPIPPIVKDIKPESPAEAAGFKPGDKITLLNGVSIEDWHDMMAYVQSHPKQPMQFVVERGGQKIPVTAESGRRLAGLHWEGYLGVMSETPVWPEGMRYTLQLSPKDAFYRALRDTWDFSVFHFVILKKMVTGEVSLSSLGGPIAIYESSSLAFHQGVVIFIAFLGLISVMLACVNILPIPGLDGGHLLFFLIEAIIRRPISVRVQALIFRLGFIFLIVLIFHATINDLMRLVG